MTEHQSVVEYLSGPEELTRKELVWGIVLEPAAPTCSHQAVVGRTFVVLATYAGRHMLGRVLVSPVDVVLDESKALVLQPDIVFVAAARARIVRDRIWGAPDLVVDSVSNVNDAFPHRQHPHSRLQLPIRLREVRLRHAATGSSRFCRPCHAARTGARSASVAGACPSC